MVDVAIIGAGPSGMTAALYALRAGKSVTVFESEGVGGQISTSPRVENFPSVKEISGAHLSDEMFDQITSLGAEIIPDKVVKVEKNDNIFTLSTEYGESVSAKTVIAATGVKHKSLNLPNEKEYLGKGVYYCAVCDGAFYKEKEVAVIGDANSALQYVMYLSPMCKKVTLIMLFDKFFADKFLIEKVKQLSNVEIIMTTQVTNYLGNGKLEALNLKNTQTNEQRVLAVDAVFIAIGQIPDNSLLKELCDIDEKGYLIADETCTTKTKGLFCAGDTRTKKVRQLTTACSDGAIAAVSASLYIDLNF